MRRTWLVVLSHIGVALAFVLLTCLLRGMTLPTWTWINPDEAELMAQGRAALDSPAPYSTWATATTGPYWPITLALLGALRFPLTLASAHLLSAVFAGLLGYLALVLFRRSFVTITAVTLAVVWWLPLALMFPLGSTTDFGALATEYLPSVLLLAVAAIPPDRLKQRTWLFALAGLLSALAVGAKYQSAPLAAALLVVQLMALGVPFRAVLKPLGYWIAGALVPVLVLVLLVITSPAFSAELMGQNVSFLGSYLSGVGPGERLRASFSLIAGQPVFWVFAVVVVVLCLRSTRRVVIERVILLVSGPIAVLGGGMGFGHYFILAYVALVLAMSRPLKDGKVFPARRWLRISLPVVAAALSLVVLVVGGIRGYWRPTTPVEFAATFSADSVPREEAMVAACPPGSRVLVWGWASELYVYYDWKNSVPFMSSYGIAIDPRMREASEPLVADAIATSDCVVDAVGAPFFFFGPEGSIRNVYPGLVAELTTDYRVEDVLDCESCTVYVRG